MQGHWFTVRAPTGESFELYCNDKEVAREVALAPGIELAPIHGDGHNLAVLPAGWYAVSPPMQPLGYVQSTTIGYESARDWMFSTKFGAV